MVLMLPRQPRQEDDDPARLLSRHQLPRHATAVVDMSVLTRDAQDVSKRRDTGCKISIDFASLDGIHTKQQRNQNLTTTASNQKT